MDEEAPPQAPPAHLSLTPSALRAPRAQAPASFNHQRWTKGKCPLSAPRRPSLACVSVGLRYAGQTAASASSRRCVAAHLVFLACQFSFFSPLTDTARVSLLHFKPPLTHSLSLSLSPSLTHSLTPTLTLSLSLSLGRWWRGSLLPLLGHYRWQCARARRRR